MISTAEYFLCFQKIPEQSIILLHACAHNPTGVDPKVCIAVLIFRDKPLHNINLITS